jgi:Secretion system C-terminal sorting domain
MKKNLLLITALLFITSYSRIVAQAPANDECPGAIGVGNTCTSPVAASTVNSTPSAGAPSCSSTDADDDIWYSFTAGTASITVSISNALLQTSGTADIGMEIYNGPCVDPSSIFCDNDIASGNGDQVVNGLNPGSKYLIRFWTTGNTSQGTFDFCLQDMNVVPVKLVSYSAVCSAGNIVITWTTAAEINSDFFTIEKSRDAVQFETLTVVHTNSNAVNNKSYSITDIHPFQNKTFYRLKQTDADGREEYFKTLSVSCGNNSKTITAYPNPVSKKIILTINNNFNSGKINILTVTGTLIRKINYKLQQGNAVEIDVENILKGMYLLQVVDNSGRMEIVKIIKQ